MSGIGHLVGLGLENTGLGFAFMTILDLGLIAGGLATYLVTRKRAHGRSRGGQISIVSVPTGK